MTTDDDFRQGLSLSHLNPPEILGFFRGLPRRVGDNLRPLHHQADTDEIVATLDSMSVTARRLTERLVSGGYPVDAEVVVDTTNRPEGIAERPEPVAALDRLDNDAFDVAGRLAGIAANRWSTDSGLLDLARSVVADIAADLRRLEDAVTSANERRLR